MLYKDAVRRDVCQEGEDAESMQVAKWCARFCVFARGWATIDPADPSRLKSGVLAPHPLARIAEPDCYPRIFVWCLQEAHLNWASDRGASRTHGHPQGL